MNPQLHAIVHRHSILSEEYRRKKKNKEDIGKLINRIGLRRHTNIVHLIKRFDKVIIHSPTMLTTNKLTILTEVG